MLLVHQNTLASVAVVRDKLDRAEKSVQLFVGLDLYLNKVGGVAVSVAVRTGLKKHLADRTSLYLSFKDLRANFVAYP